jgi:hypothetical protein
MVTPYRRFGTTYRFHLQESKYNIFLILGDGLIGCNDTSVRNYHYTLRNHPEGCGSYLLRGGSLKSGAFREIVREMLSRKTTGWGYWPACSSGVSSLVEM